jgi:hypothetical protein
VFRPLDRFAPVAVNSGLCPETRISASCNKFHCLAATFKVLQIPVAGHRQAGGIRDGRRRREGAPGAGRQGVRSALTRPIRGRENIGILICSVTQTGDSYIFGNNAPCNRFATPCNQVPPRCNHKQPCATPMQPSACGKRPGIGTTNMITKTLRVLSSYWCQREAL